MSLEANDLLEELLVLEREAIHLAVRAGDLERGRLPALEQGLSQVWSLSFGDQGCETILTGRVLGFMFDPGEDEVEDVDGLEGCAVTVVGQTTGKDYGTAFTDEHGDFALPARLLADDQDFTVTIEEPTGRFAVFEDSVNIDLNERCPFEPVREIEDNGFVLEAAAGYARLLYGICNYPLKTTLNWEDSEHGSFTVTHDGTNWTGCETIPTRAVGACSARANVATTWFMNNFLRLQVNVQIAVGGCPALSTCPPPPASSSLAEQWNPSAISSRVDPDHTGALFDATWTIGPISGTLIHPPGLVIMRIYET